MLKKAFLVVVAAFAVSVASAQVVKVGIFDVKPHLYFDEAAKKAEGAAVDYLQEISSKTGMRLEYQLLPFPRLIAMLYAGEIDIALMLSKNPEREANLVFSADSYFASKAVLIVKKESPITAVKVPADLKGLKIGHLQGSTNSPFLQENQAVFTWDLVSGDTAMQTNLDKLLGGRLDAIHGLNDVTYAYIAKQRGVVDRIRMVYTPDPAGPVYVAASKKSAAGLAFLKAYDDYVKKARPSYDAFLAKYIK